MWENENLGIGKGGMSSGRNIICRVCQEETQNWKGKIKGQNLKYFLLRWLCLNFLRYVLLDCYQQPFSSDVKSCDFICIPARDWLLKKCTIKNNCFENLKKFQFFFCFQQSIIIHFIFTLVLSACDLKIILTLSSLQYSKKAQSLFISTKMLCEQGCGHKAQLQD